MFLGLTLTNCQLEEEPLKHENQINTLNYKNDILSYLKNLRKKSNKELSAKIEELASSFDHSSLKIYDLKSTQKIIIADVRSLTGLENSDKIKTVFFMIDNKIVRSRIVTFNNKTLFDDYDKVILSILDRNKNQALYSGKISFYSLPQNILLSNEFENGKLTINGILSIKNNKSKTARANGCIDWYWVTTYQDGSQTSEYLYTTCDSCEEMANKLLTINSCGGGGSGGGTGSGPNFPFSPNINQIYDYFSPEGEHIRYQFINNIWKIILISLPDILVKSVPESRPYLVFDWPQDQQKVYGEGFVFTYEYGSGSWVGVPATDQLIAEVIEDQIDDSKLDPCPKAVLDKLKNLTQSDIASMFKKFDPNVSVFNIKIKSGTVKNPTNMAETSVISPNNYNITINYDYSNGVRSWASSSPPTTLSIATTITHEIIHAYLLSLVDEYNIGGSSTICDFPTLFDAYVTNKTTGGNRDQVNAQHDLIAEKFANTIASTIQEFHTGAPVISGYPYQVYLDLAWAGLSGTEVYRRNYPEDATHKNYAEKQRIESRIYAETYNESRGGLNPLGKPCN